MPQQRPTPQGAKALKPAPVVPNPPTGLFDVQNPATASPVRDSGLSGEALGVVSDVLNGVPAALKAKPTSAQVHLALAVLRMPVDTVSEATRLKSGLVVNTALADPGWTGASEDGAGFGVESERARGEHDHLLEMLDRSGAVIEVLETFVENCIVDEDMIVDVRAEARRVLELVKALAEGRKNGNQGTNSSGSNSGTPEDGKSGSESGVESDLETAREGHDAKLADAASESDEPVPV